MLFCGRVMVRVVLVVSRRQLVLVNECAVCLFGDIKG